MEPLFFDNASASSAPGTLPAPSVVNVHPVVLFSVLDQHLRRDPNQDRVIGVLLGTVSGGVVDVTSSFGVFHKKKRDTEVIVRRGAVNDLLALHKQANDKESVVGWYSTYSDIKEEPLGDFTLAVHSFFAEIPGACRPVHLLADVSFKAGSSLGLSAYAAPGAGAQRKTVFMFQQLRCGLVAGPEERVAIDTMTKAVTGSATLSEVAEPGTDADALDASMRRLRRLLDAAIIYVDGVVAGRTPADEAVGRAIGDAVAAVPSVEPAAFERGLAGNMQDLLMVTYLSHLTQAQIRLAERIAALTPA